MGDPPATVILDWQCFDSLTAARAVFGVSPCVYVQADADGRPVRIGKASKGLHVRYRGGTGWALDAAMHRSGNVIYVAGLGADLVDLVEAHLIWTHRADLAYNQVGKRRAPASVSIEHCGDGPTWTGPL